MTLKFRLLFSTLALFFCLSSFISAQETSSALRPIQKDGKWGYIDRTGKIVIQPQFVWAEEFSEGLAAFEGEDDKHGYVDESGKIVVEAIYDRAEPFSEGFAPVATDFKWGFIDRTGKIVIPLQYAHAFAFSGGIAPVNLFPSDGKPWTPGNEITAYIDKSGKILFDSKEDFLNMRASAGFAILQINEGGKSFLIDKNGGKILEAENIDAAGFGNDLIAVRRDKKWGYADESGKIVIPFQFDEAKKFHEGLALVLVGDKRSFINTKGKAITSRDLDIGWDKENHNFSEGLALVYANDRCAYINQSGKTVFSLDCEDAGRFIGGLALVKIGEGENEKRGYIDKAGKFVWGPAQFRYKDIEALAEKGREKAEKEENEQLLPLTAEEKNLNYRELIADQPDFIADLSFFRSETVSGGGGAERIARKGNRYRRESQFWIFVGETGKPRTRLFPETKTYDDLEPADDETLSFSNPFNPKTLAGDAKATFTPLGKMTIDGRECLKVQVNRNKENSADEKVFLYLAKNLKYLAVAAKAERGRFSFSQILRNVSLEVADGLVRIPADYKPIERDVWKKVESAKIKYNGKFSKDFGVFRSPTGELFVWVNDAKYPWHYLVRPQQATVETAFQGLLVTKNGEYVWRTKEAEAFSNISYRNPILIERKKSDAKSVIVKPKSLRFQSNDSNDIWVEVIF